MGKRKPGVYDAVIGGLPRFPGDDAVKEEKVDKLVAEMRADPDFKDRASWIAHEYEALRADQDRVAAELASVELRLAATVKIMAAAFENEELKSLTLKSGMPIWVGLEPYAKVEDPEAYRQWCLSNPDLARQMKLSWQTTNKLSKDRLVAGDPEPPGVTTYAKVKVRLG